MYVLHHIIIIIVINIILTQITFNTNTFTNYSRKSQLEDINWFCVMFTLFH